jgi:hypothetical protein
MKKKAISRKAISRNVHRIVGDDGREAHYESPEDYPFSQAHLYRAYKARMKNWNLEQFAQWLRPRSPMRLFKPSRKLKRVQDEFVIPTPEQAAPTPAAID